MKKEWEKPQINFENNEIGEVKDPIDLVTNEETNTKISILLSKMKKFELLPTGKVVGIKRIFMIIFLGIIKRNERQYCGNIISNILENEMEIEEHKQELVEFIP